MKSESLNTIRGRPKTLNRDHVLDIAMHAYWEGGVDNVSINEICKKAKISKPGLYREFGNEDGLKKAALVAFHKNVITPLLEMVAFDRPFKETLNNIVIMVSSINDHQDAKGCLMVKMLQSRMRMGTETRKQIDLFQGQMLTAFEDWVERSKVKGEFSIEMSSKFAAAYIHAQINNALTQMAKGDDKDSIREILRIALSVLLR